MLLACRYCDYLHGTVAVSAPLFLNIQPQSANSSSSSSPFKGSSSPALPAKSGKHAGKKSSAKGKAASKAAAPMYDSPHLKYTIQEVGPTCYFAPVLPQLEFSKMPLHHREHC